MSEDNEKFFYNLQSYKATIESLRSLKRPMLLWSALSLVYIYGGLHLKVDAIALWGVQITGITEEKFIIFLLLATFYYTSKWLWSNFLKLRLYWRKGFISDLRNRRMNPQKIGETGEAWGLIEGFGADTDKDIINDRDLSGTVTDFTRFSVVSRVVTFMELFGVSFVFPLLIAFVTLVTLLIRYLFW